MICKHFSAKPHLGGQKGVFNHGISTAVGFGYFKNFFFDSVLLRSVWEDEKDRGLNGRKK